MKQSLVAVVSWFHIPVNLFADWMCSFFKKKLKLTWWTQHPECLKAQHSHHVKISHTQGMTTLLFFTCFTTVNGHNSSNSQCPAPGLVVVKCSMLWCLDLLTALALTLMAVNLRLWRETRGQKPKKKVKTALGTANRREGQSKSGLALLRLWTDWISVELTSDLSAGPKKMASDTHFPFLLPGNSNCGDHMTLQAGDCQAAWCWCRCGEKKKL